MEVYSFVTEQSEVNMKFFLVVVCSFACAYAASGPDALATVVKSVYDHSPEGNFQYVYETDNGIAASAEGHLKSVGKDEVALEIVGSSQFVAPSGEKFEVTYIANEDGYQAQGAHLPTPPAPIPYPDYIVRALKYIEEHPPKEEFVSKKY